MPLIDNKDIYLEWSLAPMRGKFFILTDEEIEELKNPTDINNL